MTQFVQHVTSFHVEYKIGKRVEYKIGKRVFMVL
jgi:hypothetical protein